MRLGLFEGAIATLFFMSIPCSAGTGEKLESGTIVDAVSKSFCNAEIAARPPSLEALRSTLPTASVGQAPAQFEVNLRVSSTLSEAEMIATLLGANSGVLSLDPLFLNGPEAEMERRKFALSVCSASLTPGGISRLMKLRPTAWMEARPIETAKVAQIGNQSATVDDREGRFGPIGSKWIVPGWLMAHEVAEVRTREFRYFRLVHPVSQSMKALLVYRNQLKRGKTPIAFLRVSDRVSAESVSAWLAEKSWSPGTQLEIDRARLELSAFRRLSGSEANSALHAQWELAKIALEKAYRDWKPELNRNGVDSAIQDDWLKHLHFARVHQSFVEVVPYILNVQAEKVLSQWE